MGAAAGAPRPARSLGSRHGSVAVLTMPARTQIVAALATAASVLGSVGFAAPAAGHGRVMAHAAASGPSSRPLYADGPEGRYLLDGPWLFRRDLGNAGIRDGYARQGSAAGWSRVSVPYAWNANDTSLASMIGGIAWYRRDFTLPAGASATAWIVRFESVNYHARVWLNGHEIGAHDGAYLAWELPLVGLHRGINRLVVRTDNRRSPVDVPPAGFGVDGNPVGGWWNYGGLLREVYLRRVNRVDMPTLTVRPVLACRTCAARIAYRASVANYTGQTQRVRVQASFGGRSFSVGSAVLGRGGRATISRQQPIGHAHLWSMSDPHLYGVRVRVVANGAQAAAWSLHSGVRSIRVLGGHLFLNGQPLNLRGVGVQEDSQGLGFALDNAHRDRIVGWIQGLGAHLVRSHYPLHPYLYEQFDRDGILAWSEIPFYSLKSDAIAKPAVRRFGLGMLQTNIATNGNHPSVAIWSVANELSALPGAPETAWFNAAANTAHAADPTRPVGAAINGYPAVGCQSAYGRLDVLGLNDYFGWYPGPEGSIADRDLDGAYLDQARACYPRKALLVTEYGAESDRGGSPDERGTYEFQNAFVSFHLGLYAAKPFLSGAVYWTLQEYRVAPNWNGGNPYPVPPLGTKGLVSYTGVPKPAYAVAQQGFRSTVQAGPPSPGG